MTITEKIGASIRHTKQYSREAHIADFQVRVRENRVVLVNLKTGVVELIAADKSDRDVLLHNVRQ
jgi:hypothetical protein